MIGRFLSYVEIRTKIASVLPFLLGLFYAVYTYGAASFRNTALFFVSMLFFDMVTTALNNTIDAKSGRHPLPFSQAVSKRILILLLIAAMVSGLALAFFTGLVVLTVGAMCFAVGIFYTFGPAPISRMPLGEVFSGVFMGFFIPFLTVYVNAPPQSLVGYAFAWPALRISLNLEGLFRLAVVCVPAVCTIANLMLANNICDLEADVKVSRFTLPYYIGVKNALRLFGALYAFAFLAVAAAGLIGILPLYVLLAVFPAVFVQKNIAAFRKRQSKAETFPLSAANLLLIMLPLDAAAALAAVWR
jgi:1,4-dihydroxy-2-naphthoate octaprenyltransferase